MASDALIWLVKEVPACRLAHRLFLAVINVASPLEAVQSRFRLTVVGLHSFNDGLMNAVHRHNYRPMRDTQVHWPNSSGGLGFKDIANKI